MYCFRKLLGLRLFRIIRARPGQTTVERSQKGGHFVNIIDSI